MLALLARNWWLVALRGALFVLFGLMAFAWPGLSLVTLVLLYGVFAIADGVVALVAAIKGRGTGGATGWLIFVGIAGLIAGVITLLWPGLTALALLYLIAWWCIVKGLFEIVGAIRIRKEIDNEWWLVLGGALSVVFGAILIMRPGAGALALIWLIAVWAIVIGVTLLALAFRLRSHGPVHARA
jgi:uncharacterized membrane protein HdeD (DUF308 family)